MVNSQTSAHESQDAHHLSVISTLVHLCGPRNSQRLHLCCSIIIVATSICPSGSASATIAAGAPTVFLKIGTMRRETSVTSCMWVLNPCEGCCNIHNIHSHTHTHTQMSASWPLTHTNQTNSALHETWRYAAHWGKRQDKNLLLGVCRHGYGRWLNIVYDPDVIPTQSVSQGLTLIRN